MSERNINITERREGEDEVPDEELSLPSEVYNANWRDDVADEAEEEKEAISLVHNANWRDDVVDEAEEKKEAISFKFEPYKNERGYKSKLIVSEEAENLIDAFDRSFLQENGRKTLKILRSSHRDAEYERAA
ncbi:hypothetical protein IKG31_00455 [Candidatus Saccharibacteria bacterium]|nr:hypothetical protein [Candidatus Saccharibacteria bacterium]